jgi:hypothetical protein
MSWATTTTTTREVAPGRWALCALVVVAALGMSAGVSWGQGAGLGEGWAPAGEGDAAMQHTPSMARLEAWSASLAEEEVAGFTSGLESRLASGGCAASGREEVVVSGYPAQVRRCEASVLEQGFQVAVLTLYRRGVLWSFSAVWRASEELGDEAVMQALTTFAASKL